jgi:hypothetical protein
VMSSACPSPPKWYMSWWDQAYYFTWPNAFLVCGTGQGGLQEVSVTGTGVQTSGLMYYGYCSN